MSQAEITPDDPDFVYDEFAYFDENCAEYGIERPADLRVERVGFPLGDGRVVSGLRWGSGAPQAVFLHGGAQNSHTWDTVLLALDIDALALDLPGHGRSSWRDDGRYDPRSNAEAIAAALDGLGVSDVLLVGMSLGGLTATSLAAARPDLVRSLVVVDVTPGVDANKTEAIHAFIAGPQSFPSFDEILARTIEFNPTRTVSSLRRGILHNAHRVTEGPEAGSWRWNYDRRRLTVEDMPSMTDLWEDVSAVRAPYTLVRGGASPVVDDADVAELRRRQPDVEVIRVEGAGHSVQGDDPLRLAEILRPHLRG